MTDILVFILLEIWMYDSIPDALDSYLPNPNGMVSPDMRTNSVSSPVVNET